MLQALPPAIIAIGRGFDTRSGEARPERWDQSPMWMQGETMVH